MKRRLLFEAAFFLKQWRIGAMLRRRMVVLALIGLSTYGAGAINGLGICRKGFQGYLAAILK